MAQMVRSIRRNIARTYSKDMGFKTDRSAVHRFWQNVKDGTLFKTRQFKAVETARRKNQRESEHRTWLRKAQTN